MVTGQSDLKSNHKRVFICGGAGFIGSHFAKLLFRSGYSICIYDKLTYAGSRGNLTEILDKIIFIEGDICNESLVNQSLNDFNPSWLVNFAAESHVDRSITSPADFVRTNILGTYTLLNVFHDYYRKKKSRSNYRFLQVSSDEVFGSLGKNGAFTETSPYLPSSPYSATKASSDHLVRAWHCTYGLPTLITYSTNTYGPNQHSEKFIPLVIRNCLNNQKVPIYGNGENVREWIYVEDHCQGILKVLENGRIGHSYALGSDIEISNIDLAKFILTYLDRVQPGHIHVSYLDLLTLVEDRKGHDYRYSIDFSKARTHLGFQPVAAFSETLQITIDWYRKLYTKKNQ
jgi:dTDP-glucose 4,6-dehydratase